MSDHASTYQPLVSVVVPTYQHVHYIAACLEGILGQETLFPVEILVGEDESSDGTREICQQFARAYPGRIRLFLRSRKDVIHINGRPTGRANFLALLNAAKGTYIALCEGDDHWIDKKKLQQQITLLEADPNAVACFTNAYNEIAGVRTEYLDGVYTKRPGPIVQQSELVNGQGLPTCTVIFRKSALLPIPKCLYKSPTADTALYCHVSNTGHFVFLPDITAVRVMHPGGIHSLKNASQKRLTTLRNLPILDKVSHYRHHALIMQRQQHLLISGWKLALKENNMALARYCWPRLARMRDQVGWSIPNTARHYLRIFWPRTEAWLVRAWARLRGRRTTTRLGS